jgi:hypothetical protein
MPHQDETEAVTPNRDAASIVAALTLEQNASLLSGASFWTTKEVPSGSAPRSPRRRGRSASTSCSDRA